MYPNVGTYDGGIVSVVELLRLKPIFQPRVWGGDRLDPGARDPIGEAWVVYEGNVVDGGAWSGYQLADVTAALGARFLGQPVVERTGDRFPLLIKLLDSREWLSVQVHPNDEQAKRLEGPDMFGKTEAWHVLEADAGAEVIFGLEGDPSVEELRRRVDDGTFEEVLAYVKVEAGDTLFMPAGRVHAIGPGLFIYEVQQTSDITYRLYDWNRPLTGGRALHLDKGLEVIAPAREDDSQNRASRPGAERGVLAGCEYFVLEMVDVRGGPVKRSTEGRSFHAITVTEGEAEITAGRDSVQLQALQTVVVPAAIGDYAISPVTSSRALVSSVP